MGFSGFFLKDLEILEEIRNSIDVTAPTFRSAVTPVIPSPHRISFGHQGIDYVLVASSVLTLSMNNAYEAFWIHGRPTLKIQRSSIDALKMAFSVLHLFLDGPDE